MDPVALAFYATVCGCLSLLSPILSRGVARLAVGAAVGIAAAMVLPWLRGLAGF